MKVRRRRRTFILVERLHFTFFCPGFAAFSADQLVFSVYFQGLEIGHPADFGGDIRVTAGITFEVAFITEGAFFHKKVVINCLN